MTGGQIMVVLIVAIVMIATVIKSGRHRHRDGGEAADDNGEAAGLRREVAQLKERLAVLERIAVEKEGSLERQIEELRNR